MLNRRIDPARVRELVADGKKYHEIAALLGVSESSIGSALRRDEEKHEHDRALAKAKKYDGLLVDGAPKDALLLESHGYLRRAISYNPKHYVGRPRVPRYVLVATEACG